MTEVDKLTFLENLASSVKQTEKTKEMKEMLRTARKAKARQAACNLGLLDFCRRCNQTRHALQSVPKCTVSGGLYHPGFTTWRTICDGSDKQRFVREECIWSCCDGWPHSEGCRMSVVDHDFERVEK